MVGPLTGRVADLLLADVARQPPVCGLCRLGVAATRQGAPHRPVTADATAVAAPQVAGAKGADGGVRLAPLAGVFAHQGRPTRRQGRHKSPKGVLGPGPRRPTSVADVGRPPRPFPTGAVVLDNGLGGAAPYGDLAVRGETVLRKADAKDVRPATCLPRVAVVGRTVAVVDHVADTLERPVPQADRQAVGTPTKTARRGTRPARPDRPTAACPAP